MAVARAEGPPTEAGSSSSFRPPCDHRVVSRNRFVDHCIHNVPVIDQCSVLVRTRSISTRMPQTRFGVIRVHNLAPPLPLVAVVVPLWLLL